MIEDFGVDLLGELCGGGGGHVSAPDQLIDGAGFAEVIAAGESAVENCEIEVGDLAVGGQAVAEKQAVRTADGKRKGQEKFADGKADGIAAGVEIALHAGGERFADAQAGLHDSLALNLGEVVIRQEKMHLPGKGAFEFGGSVQGLANCHRRRS